MSHLQICEARDTNSIPAEGQAIDALMRTRPVRQLADDPG